MGSAAIEVGQNEFVTVQQERYELVSNFQLADPASSFSPYFQAYCL